MLNVKLSKLEKEIYNSDLHYFIKRCFNIINPNTKYVDNWHIEAISRVLEKVEDGTIKRLIINMPPRYLKSICASVVFPAWIMGRFPNKRIIVASYSEKLSLKHSTDCRLIMESDFFKRIFPDCTLSNTQNQKYKFATARNGYRFATSVNGTLTGEGGDILIIDDPHNPNDIFNSNLREKTINWYSNVFSSRLNDKKNGTIIIVMQRLHPNDLSGYLLEKNKDLWYHLNLQAISDIDYKIDIGNFKKIFKKGEILFPAREGKNELEKIKNDMGTYTFNAQYQQKPLIQESSMIKKSWLKEYDDKIEFENVFLSFDTAIKAGINNDPTVCTVWGEYKNSYYLFDVVREWLEYPELKKISIDLIKKYGPTAVLIEDKASGQSLIQDLKNELRQNIIPIKITKDKITRFASVTPFFESGRIFILENTEWIVDYKNELLSFPNSLHDDQVDSTSQFLNWIKTSNKHYKQIKIRKI